MQSINLPVKCKVLEDWRSYKVGDEFICRTAKELHTATLWADLGVFEIEGYKPIVHINRPAAAEADAGPKVTRKSKSRKVKLEPSPEPEPKPEGSGDVED